MRLGLDVGKERHDRRPPRLDALDRFIEALENLREDEVSDEMFIEQLVVLVTDREGANIEAQWKLLWEVLREFDTLRTFLYNPAEGFEPAIVVLLDGIKLIFDIAEDTSTTTEQKSRLLVKGLEMFGQP